MYSMYHIAIPLSDFHYQYELNYDYTYSTIITIANTLFILIVSTYGFNTIYKTAYMFITEHIRYSVLKERQELIWIVDRKKLAKPYL